MEKEFRLNRLFSTPLSQILLRFPITPNQVTCFSLALGITAGFLFYQGHYLSALLGAFCYELACVLDNCDGDIARAKKLGSSFGAWFDICADFVTDLSLFLGLGLGMLKNGFHEGTFICLLLCVTGALAHFLLVVIEKKKGFGPAQFDKANPDSLHRENFLYRVFDALREGDSSWIVVIFALFGQAHTLIYFGAFYMQALWITAFIMNRRYYFGAKA